MRNVYSVVLRLNNSRQNGVYIEQTEAPESIHYMVSKGEEGLQSPFLTSFKPYRSGMLYNTTDIESAKQTIAEKLNTSLSNIQFEME